MSPRMPRNWANLRYCLSLKFPGPCGNLLEHARLVLTA